MSVLDETLQTTAAISESHIATIGFMSAGALAIGGIIRIARGNIYQPKSTEPNQPAPDGEPSQNTYFDGGFVRGF